MGLRKGLYYSITFKEAINGQFTRSIAKSRLSQRKAI